MALAFSLKRKALDQAQKYVQKGAYDKAVKEYQKHLQTEPGDTNARLKLGDVHLKRGDKQAAIDTYKQVAGQFSKSGFDAKAVAIYKQILRIDEGYLEARIQLGDHFQRMGLPSDALREFQEAVKLCKERGLKRDAFDLLKRVAALDPTNVRNRLQLAELLVREKLMDEAREEYGALLEEVERQEDPEQIAKVADRMIEAFPDEERGFACAAQARLKLDQADEALQTLTVALSSFRTSVALREILVAVHDTRGDASAVRATWREIAGLYKQRGDADRARDILQRHCPVEAFGDSEQDTSPSLLLEEPAEDLSALGANDPDTDSIALTDEEAPSISFDVDDVDASGAVEGDDLPDLDSPAGETQSGVQSDEILAEARVSLDFEDREGALRLIEKVLKRDPKNADALALRAKARAKPEPKAPEPAPPEPVEAPDLLGEDEEAATSGLGDSLPDIELVLEDDRDDDDDFISIEPPTHVDLQPIAPELDFEPSGEVEIDLDGLDGLDDLEDDDSDAGQAHDANDSTAVGRMIEEAERLFEAEQWAEAEEAYQSVLEQSPHHPQALVRLGELASRRGREPDDVNESTAPSGPALDLDLDLDLDSSGGEDVAEGAEGEGESGTDLDVQLPDELEAPVVAAEAEAEEEESLFDAGSLLDGEDDDEDEAEADEVLDAEALLAEDAEEEGGEVLDAASLLAEQEAEEAAEQAAGDDGFDLAAALDEEGAPQIDMNQSGAGFEEVFRAFKKGIQEQVAPEEAEAHYDLAIAYKEMGLFEDALEQLELVRRSEAHQVDGLALMATCKMELGRPEEAAGHLSEALALAPEGDDSIIALRYDLGIALLGAGQKGEALDAFKKCAAADSDFRDVTDQIAALE